MGVIVFKSAYMKLSVDLLFCSCLIGFTGLASESYSSKVEYTKQWKTLAVQHMQTYNIPASITLAQAILESSAGNSKLAKLANNHFGIKCNGWTGKTIHMDDDQKGECFRSYDNAKASFEDHAEFLKGRERYAFLFQYTVTDYKSWAKGLKTAGYATNPQYDKLLIDIIEELKLDLLDEGIPINSPTAELISKSNHQVVSQPHKSKYIAVKKGDTYYKIAKEFDLGLWQLYKYNDLEPNRDLLREGERLYIQPKRNRSKMKFIVLKEALTLRQLSQLEGVKLKNILKANPSLIPDLVLPVGEKVTLR